MSTATDILKRYWGFSAFRPLQKEIIDQVLAGHDVLALLPTGGGKSLCYQVPALVREGLTIVISPLIALMKDQVSRLKSIGVSAEAVYSGMHPKEIDRVLDNARFGHTRLLYVSPERLKTEMFRQRLPTMPVCLIAVDEAHCISQWGHDFRPSYLDIGEIRAVFPKLPMIALTASATREVRDEILDRLGMKQAVVIKDSFARSNLRYHVVHREDQIPYIERLLLKSSGSVIVYARHRRKCVELAHWFSQKGMQALAYHGGMNMEDRDRIQEQWITGKTRIIVATNAFGMGVDKADVRLVVHYDLPPGLEEYYQEAGRAGRDGHEAYCIVVVKPASVTNLTTRVESSFPDMESIRYIYRSLHVYLGAAVGSGLGETFDFDLDAFAARYSLKPVDVHTGLDILARDGWLGMDADTMRGSTLQFIAEPEALYAYQGANEEVNVLTKALLRGYEGLWTSGVHIHEKRIADFLKWKESKVEQWLTRLSAESIVSYHRPSAKNQITLLRERVPEQNFTIDQKAYAFRKKRAMDRMKMMVAYLDEHVGCREVFIRHYFDEQEALACGHCDRCIARSRPSVKGVHSIYSDIPDREGVTIRDFLSRYGPEHLAAVKQELQQLAAEDKIRIVEDKIYRKV